MTTPLDQLIHKFGSIREPFHWYCAGLTDQVIQTFAWIANLFDCMPLEAKKDSYIRNQSLHYPTASIS